MSRMVRRIFVVVMISVRDAIVDVITSDLTMTENVASSVSKDNFSFLQRERHTIVMHEIGSVVQCLELFAFVDSGSRSRADRLMVFMDVIGKCRKAGGFSVTDVACGRLVTPAT